MLFQTNLGMHVLAFEAHLDARIVANQHLRRRVHKCAHCKHPNTASNGHPKLGARGRMQVTRMTGRRHRQDARAMSAIRHMRTCDMVRHFLGLQVPRHADVAQLGHRPAPRHQDVQRPGCDEVRSPDVFLAGCGDTTSEVECNAELQVSLMQGAHLRSPCTTCKVEKTRGSAYACWWTTGWCGGTEIRGTLAAQGHGSGRMLRTSMLCRKWRPRATSRAMCCPSSCHDSWRGSSSAFVRVSTSRAVRRSPPSQNCGQRQAPRLHLIT